MPPRQVLFAVLVFAGTPLVACDGRGDGTRRPADGGEDAATDGGGSDAGCEAPVTITGHSPEWVVHDSSTSSIDLTVRTDCPAECRWDTLADTSHEDMPNALAGADTSHSTTLEPLEPGSTYRYFVRCADVFGAMEESYPITYRILPVADDPFPRLGLVLHGCVIEDEADEESAARYDLLVVHEAYTEEAPDDCDARTLQRIRSANPGVKILVHQPQSYTYLPTEGWPGDGSYPREGDILYPLLDGVVFHGAPEDRWMLTDTAGNTIEELSPTPWDQAIVDVTPFCPVKEGTTDWDYNHQNVGYTRDVLVASGVLDGVFWDSLYDSIQWIDPYLDLPIDVDHDGVPDEGRWLDEQWKTGVDAFYAHARETLGPDILMIGNGAHSQYGDGNGMMIEVFYNQPWDAKMRYLRDWVENGRSPVLNMVVAFYDQANAVAARDFRYPRYVFGSAMLASAYFELMDEAFGYTEFYWLDEYAVDPASGQAIVPGEENGWTGRQYLGDARGAARDLGLEPGSHPSGVWRRDFANGIVLVNPNDAPIDVDLGENLRKVEGTQDPVNDGTEVSQVTLQARDALVLLR